MKPPKRPARPLGTDPSFCVLNSNRLYVPLRAFDATAFPGYRQDLCFEYEDTASAARAKLSIERKLRGCGDPWSAALRSNYSNLNVLEFLRRSLEHDGLLFMQWTGRVRLTGSRLMCLLPNDRWENMHFEDLVHTSIDWQAVGQDPTHCDSAPTLMHTIHNLSPESIWEAVTGISRPIWKCGFLICRD